MTINDISSSLRKAEVSWDDIKILESKGEGIFDLYTTKDVISIFLDNKINFKCSSIDDGLYQINLVS